jgi:hypothetical protein
MILLTTGRGAFGVFAWRGIALDRADVGVPLRVLLVEVERHVQPGVALERADAPARRTA